MFRSLVPVPAPAQDKKEQVSPSERPSSEEMITRYTRMLDQMTAALDAELGEHPWSREPHNGTLDWAACPDDDLTDAVTVDLPTPVMDGRYAEDPAPTLDRVLERHGFSRLGDSRGAKTSIRRATDQFGGRLELLEGLATVLSVRTGCHRNAAHLGDFVLPPAGSPARQPGDASD